MFRFPGLGSPARGRRPTLPETLATWWISAPWMSLVLLAGCAGAPPEPVKSPPLAAESPQVEAPFARPELTSDEQALLERLQAHVARLDRLGERSPERPWELADASDYVAGQFEELGYPVERQGYDRDGVVAQNLSVTAFGGERGDQVIVVGAHYDSPRGSSGKNGGAASTAALIELARMMNGAKLKRTIQFSAFAMGESPHGDGEGRGARSLVRSVRKRQAKDQEKLAREQEQKRRGELPADLPELAVDRSRFVTMISLEKLLAYEQEGDSGPLWVHVRSTPPAAPFAGAVARALDEPPFLVKRQELEFGAADSDALAFHEAEVPVVVLSGSGEAGGNDLDGLTRVVMALRRALGEMAEEQMSEGLLLSP